MYVLSTNLITGGTDTGMGRMAGYWFNNVTWFTKNNKCFGFAPWGVIKGRDTLNNTEEVFALAYNNFVFFKFFFVMTSLDPKKTAISN